MKYSGNFAPKINQKKNKATSYIPVTRCFKFSPQHIPNFPAIPCWPDGKMYPEGIASAF